MRQARQQGLDAVFPIRAASPEPNTARCAAPGSRRNPLPTTDADERADDTRGRVAAWCLVCPLSCAR